MSVDIKPNDNIGEVWYTFSFGKGNVSIYAGSTGYDESKEALVGIYEHNMTNITSKGPVFLKITGNNVRVEEISLMRPGSTAGNQ